MFLRFACLVACISTFFLFIAKQYFIVPEFVGLFTNEEHSGCFQFLVIINNAALNVIHCKCRFLCECKFSFFYGKWIPRNGIAECCKCTFNFIRNCQTVFQTDFTNLHSEQQCIRVLVSWPPCQHLALSVSLLFVLLFLFLIHSKKCIMASHYGF